jgi:hypothetical protein
VRDLGLYDVAALCGGEVIGAFPFVRVELSVGTQFSRLEGFEQNGFIAKKIDTQLIEVLCAPAQREIGAPIVRIARQRHKATWLKVTQDISARSDGRLTQSGCRKVLAVPLGLFQYRAQTGDQGQLTILCVEREPDRTRAGLFNLVNLRPKPAISQVSFGPEGFVGPDDIFNGHRTSV